MNKTALITGVSRGIGRSIAIAFAHNGYNIIGTCKENIDLMSSLETKVKSYGVNFFGYLGDLSEFDESERLFNLISKHNLTIDILVNNAGISQTGLLQDITKSDWFNIWNTNVTSVVAMSKQIIPHFLLSGQGKIINISSVWGNVGASCEAAYSATKGAVNSFTKALAKELAPSNIQVNAIACGIINTDMNSHLSSDDIKAIVSDIPANRIGSPSDIANVALSIASSTGYMTGQIITVDGGWI